MLEIFEFRDFIYEQHDTVCNQKYGDGLPYSFHLKAVVAQGEKFMYLIEDRLIVNPNNSGSLFTNLRDIVRHALVAHDVIEDGRITYNDLLKSINLNYVAATMAADIVYCVTDEKGKNRSDRKNDKFYSELKLNKLAIFVKLSDLAANTLYSKLTGSSMYDRYKSEFSHFKEELYIEEYKDFFDYIENL